MCKRRGQTSIPRTLVIGVNWLGDTIMSLPALEALRELFPHEIIHFGAPASLLPLIRMAAPMDEFWGWSRRDSTLSRIRRVRNGRYGRVVLFPNSFRSAWIAWWARVPERWGCTGQMRHWLLNRPSPKTYRPQRVHQSQHYLNLIRHLGWTGKALPRLAFRIPEGAQRWADETLDDWARGRTLVGLCPGATYGPAKRWSPERFAAVGRALQDRHRVKILLMGTAEQARFIHALAEMIGPDVLDLSGRTDIEQLAAVLSRCDVVISNDSGPMHLAAALGTPVVALFGSTDPAATGPMGPHRIVRSNASCAPCLKRRCPEGTYRCLQEIQSEQVLAEAEDLLRDPNAARAGT